MKIPFSKKELFRDNCKLQKELDELIRVNMHLRLAVELQKKSLKDANDRIQRANKIISKDNNDG